MIFTKTDLPGVYIIDIERKEDPRGFFARVTCVDEFATHGFSFQPVQASIAWNIRRGTVRGLHYQAPPHAEAKIVRCTAGAITTSCSTCAGVADLRPLDRPRTRPPTDAVCSLPKVLHTATKRWWMTPRSTTR
jgi:dTDP-4-dehydrorhamnose 3,5-epimerase